MTQQKAPIPANEAARLKALDAYQILDTAAESEFDAITSLASYICGTPIALITLLDANRQWFKSNVGMDISETEREISFCQYAIMDNTLMEIPDAQLDDRFKDNPLVTDEKEGIRFYAGVPLEAPGGLNLGALCVVDTVPRHLTEEQRTALHTLAQQVMLQLEMRRRNQSLREEKEVAEQSVAAKNAFLANMSHEIRTPMNAIIGFADVLAKTALTTDQRDYVEAISQAGEKLLLIINDILDFSKIDSGKILLEHQPFQLKELLKTVQTLFRLTAAEKGLEYDFFLDADLPDVVTGDQLRLNQILINLVGNAFKFTHRGSVTVAVKVVAATDEQVTLRFSVTDTGVGIPQDKLDTIFERFTQANSSTTREFGGTGLGLSISKNLVDLHGGTISVSSEPGRGSVFAFELTYPKVAKPATVASAAKARLQQPTGPINILLCEDNVLNQRLAQSVLSGFGFGLTIAGNGKEGIELLRHQAFDLIIMDLQMPEMDGYEATAIIRNELKLTTPIMALTAHSMEGEKERCLSLGMNDYLGKPFRQEELHEHIVRLLQPETDEEPIGNVHIDLSYLKSLSGGNTAFEQEMISLFLVEVKADLAELEEGFARTHYPQIRKVAHKLRSSLPLTGLHGLIPLLAAIEKAATEETITPTIRTQFAYLATQLHTSFPALEQLLD